MEKSADNFEIGHADILELNIEAAQPTQLPNPLVFKKNPINFNPTRVLVNPTKIRFSLCTQQWFCKGWSSSVVIGKLLNSRCVMGLCNSWLHTTSRILLTTHQTYPMWPLPLETYLRLFSDDVNHPCAKTELFFGSCKILTFKKAKTRSKGSKSDISWQHYTGFLAFPSFMGKK